MALCFAEDNRFEFEQIKKMVRNIRFPFAADILQPILHSRVASLGWRLQNYSIEAGTTIYVLVKIRCSEQPLHLHEHFNEQNNTKKLKQKDMTESSSPFQLLPLDCVKLILSQLDSDDLKAASLTCQNWKEIIFDSESLYFRLRCVSTSEVNYFLGSVDS